MAEGGVELASLGGEAGIVPLAVGDQERGRVTVHVVDGDCSMRVFSSGPNRPSSRTS